MTDAVRGVDRAVTGGKTPFSSSSYNTYITQQVQTITNIHNVNL